MNEKFVGVLVFLVLFSLSVNFNPFKEIKWEADKPALSNVYDRKPEFNSLQDVHNKIWRQIDSLQEEGDCEKKKILICENIDSYAGFGSMVMRYGACLQIAYALGRIYFIRQRHYAHFGGLSQWLQSGSKRCGYLLKKYGNDTCNLHDAKCYLQNGFDVNNTHKVLEYTPNMRFPAPRTIPGTIPKSLKEVLLSLKVEKPWLWFTSQFVGYLVLRPNEKFRKLFNDFAKNMDYRHPIVSMHIRRGDKIGREAQFVPASKFLKASDTFYEKNFSKVTKRRIYVASDDKNITKELKSSTKQTYSICKLSDEYLAKSLHPYKKAGFPKEVIESILLDLYYLNDAEYTICTYTSNICRLLHSLKLSSYPYNTESLSSVDVPKLSFYWWFGYTAPFVNYWVSRRANKKNMTFLDGKMLFPYTTGTLFTSRGTKLLVTDGRSTVAVLEMHTVYKFRNDAHGYVYADDVIAWPGEPEYHFYKSSVP